MEKYSAIDTGDDLERVLNGFMHEMRTWEAKYYQKSIESLDKSSLDTDLEELMRNDLLNIFRKYVLEKGRNYDRVANLVCGKHPEYDDENDEIHDIKVSKKEASVTIRKTKGLTSVFRLIFTIDNGVFMVSGREFQHGQKWQKTYV
ncbi:NTF2 fold immunity protein [Pseudomonas putida]|uniref:NTF2 fold immunity protein n=1 Tax=Pseudomonas putida TaxID=303 RepID=UPI0009A13E47|nr:NTF2 fold immunity protein [Pseudomonas putida]